MMSVQMSNFGCIFLSYINSKIALVEREEGREMQFCSCISSEANICNSNFDTLHRSRLFWHLEGLSLNNFEEMEIGCNTH